MHAEKDPTKPKAHKVVGVRSVVLIIISALVILTISQIYLLVKPDGTQNLLGAKKEVATKAIKYDEEAHSVSPLPRFTQQIYIKEVRPIRPDERQYCIAPNLAYSTSPNNPQHYAVVLSELKWPGFATKTVTEYGCEFLQRDF